MGLYVNRRDHWTELYESRVGERAEVLSRWVARAPRRGGAQDRVVWRARPTCKACRAGHRERVSAADVSVLSNRQGEPGVPGPGGQQGRRSGSRSAKYLRGRARLRHCRSATARTMRQCCAGRGAEWPWMAAATVSAKLKPPDYHRARRVSRRRVSRGRLRRTVLGGRCVKALSERGGHVRRPNLRSSSP